MLCSFCYSNNSRLFLFGHIALEFVLRCNALRSIAKKLLQDNALKPKEKPKGNSFHLRLLCAFPLCHLSAARTTCGHFCRLSRIVYAAFPSTLLPGARHTHTRHSTVDAFTEALKTSRNSAQIYARPAKRPSVLWNILARTSTCTHTNASGMAPTYAHT